MGLGRKRTEAAPYLLSNKLNMEHFTPGCHTRCSASPAPGFRHIQERWGRQDKGPTAQAGCDRACPCICSRVIPTAAGSEAKPRRSERERGEMSAESQGCFMQREGAVMLWGAPAAAWTHLQPSPLAGLLSALQAVPTATFTEREL